jgi:hypothetical protein
MTEERRLSKVEACLGLSLLAGLLVVLVGVYVYRCDQRPPITPPDPHWSSGQPAAAVSSAISHVSDRPEWLSPQNQPQAVMH